LFSCDEKHHSPTKLIGMVFSAAHSIFLEGDMNSVEITRRSVVCMGLSLASATVVTGPAIAAGPATCPGPDDPIHQAIAAHAAAVRHVDLEGAKLDAAGDPEVSDWGALRYAALAEIDAGKAVVETRPTTLAGLDALERHLRDKRYRRATLFVVRRVACGDGFAVIRGGEDGVGWLLQQHAVLLA
jgi:hypothetical protein